MKLCKETKRTKFRLQKRKKKLRKRREEMLVYKMIRKKMQAVKFLKKGYEGVS